MLTENAILAGRRGSLKLVGTELSFFRKRPPVARISLYEPTVYSETIDDQNTRLSTDADFEAEEAQHEEQETRRRTTGSLY